MANDRDIKEIKETLEEMNRSLASIQFILEQSNLLDPPK